MPRRPRSQSSSSSHDVDSLFAELLDDEIGTSGGETAGAVDAGKRGIPPAIADQPADAAAPETALDDPICPNGWRCGTRATIRGI